MTDPKKVAEEAAEHAYAIIVAHEKQLKELKNLYSDFLGNVHSLDYLEASRSLERMIHYQSMNTCVRLDLVSRCAGTLQNI